MIDLVRLLPQSPVPFSLPVNEKWHIFLPGENCRNRPIRRWECRAQPARRTTSLPVGRSPAAYPLPPTESESPGRPSDTATEAARFWEAAQEPRSRFRSLLLRLLLDLLLDLRESLRTALRCPTLAVAVSGRISRLPPARSLEMVLRRQSFPATQARENC